MDLRRIIEHKCVQLFLITRIEGRLPSFLYAGSEISLLCVICWSSLMGERDFCVRQRGTMKQPAKQQQSWISEFENCEGSVLILSFICIYCHLISTLHCIFRVGY